MVKFDTTKLYGILNELDGTPIRRKVRSLKVGIGLPKGPDVHVWIDVNGKFCLGVGRYEKVGNATHSTRIVDITRHETREEIRAKYLEARRTAPVRPYPVKLNYFTFLRIGLEGDYVHDLDVIFEHGSMPTEVEVVFLMEDPLDAKFQYFTAAGLHCEGNGLDARRRVSMAERPGAPDEEKKLAEEAIDRGEKWYPIEDGCYARGCPFGNSNDPKKAPLCKPHGRLHFHLISSPTVGSTTTFDTTGKRSINQLQTCLDEVSNATKKAFPPNGTVVGIPLTLRVAPYRVQRPDGAPTTQHAVSLEARGANAMVLWKTMLTSAAEMHNLIEGGDIAPPRQIGAGTSVPASEPATRPTEVPPEEVKITDEIAAGEPDMSAADEASAFTAEFHTGVEEEDDDSGNGSGFVESTQAAQQTEPTGEVRSLADLKNKLKKNDQTGGAQAETAPAAETVSEATQSEAGPQSEATAPTPAPVEVAEPGEPSLEGELANCQFVADINRLRVQYTEAAESPEEKTRIEGLCDDRVTALRAAKRAKANGQKAIDSK